MTSDNAPTPSSLLAALLRVRLLGDLAPVAIIGPGAGEMSAALRAVGYERIWQRETSDAVLSLFQPGRLFDAIVLAGCLGPLIDLSCPEQDGTSRAFDQIDASLADAGFVCATVPNHEAEQIDRQQLTTDHGQLSPLGMDSLMRLFATHGFQLDVMDSAAAGDPAETTLVGIFSRREGK